MDDIFVWLWEVLRPPLLSRSLSEPQERRLTKWRLHICAGMRVPGFSLFFVKDVWVCIEGWAWFMVQFCACFI